MVSLIPKFKSEAERNVIDLLKNSLNKLSSIVNQCQRQNLSIGFNKILIKSVTSTKSQPYQRFPDLSLK